MATRFLAGQAITRTIYLVDAAGANIDASAVSYRVLDQAGTVVEGPTSVTPWTEGVYAVTLTVVAGDNALPTGELRALRTIELTLTTDEGLILLTSEYIIEALEPLAVPTNSFQTLAAAQLLAFELPNVPGWDGATRDQRVAALIQARINISEISFRYVFDDWMTHIEPEFGVSDLKLLDANEYAALSSEFRAALVRAQIYEADAVLTMGAGNSVESRRAMGILSETIGESSVTYRKGGAQFLMFSICDRALRILAKYINRRIRIGRA